MFERSPRDHPLEGAWLKLKWAKVNLETLQDQAGCFFGDESDPDSLRGYLNIEKPGRLTKGRLETPWHWPLLVGDVLHAYRASLDYLAWELARWNLRRLAKDRRPSRKTGFPLVSDPDDWSDKLPALRNISSPHRDQIEKFQPYNCKPERPDKAPLDWLRDLSNRDKHQTLNLMVAQPGFVEENLEYATPGWALISSAESATATITDAEGNPKQSMQMKTAFYIELEGVTRIDWVLDGIGPEVAKIIRSFEPVFEDT